MKRLEEKRVWKFLNIFMIENMKKNLKMSGYLILCVACSDMGDGFRQVLGETVILEPI